jgi:hypothetical protein
MGLWGRFWRLSGPERRLAVEAAMAVALTRMGLRVAGYSSWISLAARLTPNKKSFQPNKQPVERIATMLNATARHLPFQATCLERSIGLWWMLRRRGYYAELRLGARVAAERFEAHAWIERGGVVLNDAAGHYLSFSSFPQRLTDPGPEAQ